MAVLLHITDLRHGRAIRHSGLKAGSRGIYAVPVTSDYMTTHQWSRELKRSGAKIPIAVYFRMPGKSIVRVGRYNKPHRSMSLSDAIAMYLKRAQPLGFEIIFDDDVPRRNVLRIKPMRRPTGWRFSPTAKGTQPDVWRGEYGAARTRARRDPAEKTPPFDDLKTIIGNTEDPSVLSKALWDLASKRRRASCDFLEPLVVHPDPDVQFDLITALERFTDPLAIELTKKLVNSHDKEVREYALEQLADD